MSYQYASLDELIKDLLPGSVGNDDEKAAIGRVLEGVSNFIDRFCRRPEKYFLPYDDETEATTRVFVGEGTRFLRIPIHKPGSVSIAGIGGELIYEHHENGWIYAKQTGGERAGLGEIVFREGLEFTVSAVWGFSEIPAAIREVARQLTLRTWETQRGIFGELSPNGTVIERAMPPFVESILIEFRRRQFEIS